MKKSILVAALFSVFAGSAFAGGSAPNAVTSSGFNNVNLNNTVTGSVTVVNGGFSESQATNTETATGMVGSSIATGKSSLNGQNANTQTVGVTGSTSLSSSSTAWNVSSGNANGNASSFGGVGSVVGGNNVIPNVATGSGYTGVGSTNSITANTNQGGYTASTASSDFGTSQTYTSAANSVSVSSTLTGDATASNASGAMVVNGVTLNIPTSISIGDSATFTATGTDATGINESAPTANTRD
jgi:hypothetical protein